MYVDARKHDYTHLSQSEAAQAIARDKKYAKEAYIKWFESNVEQVIDRLWEIDDVGVVEKIGEFIKLLKEAEFTYSLGAYQSAIALIGVSAEDLCRFFANETGNNLDKLKQNDRINSLRQKGLIDQKTSDHFHDIRKLRNDCLHFNDGFKKKSEASLKSDAQKAINLLKAVYARIIGATSYNSIDINELIKIMEAITQGVASGNSENVVNFEDAIIRFRNIFSKATGVDLSINLGGEKVLRFSIYQIDEIDLDMEQPEVTLIDVAGGVPVIVDLAKSDIDNIQQIGVVEGDKIMAAVSSETNGLGMTAAWKFVTNPIVIGS